MKSKLVGSEMDRMPNMAFRIMSAMFKIADWINPKDHYIDNFGIRQGSIVMDYGCGPGRHIKRASELTGEKGLVYAVDIHELAIESVNRLVRKKNLHNVKTLLVKDIREQITDRTVDLVYALDMFHMVSDTDDFLKGIHRIIRPGGLFILEYGHQPGKNARSKVLQAGCWNIDEETGGHLKCTPL
jgi:cyclopropane fatty-acyl-phospholipid synthase-like methyltransferase